jgi:soluble lytic murein transglycosylase-like protein
MMRIYWKSDLRVRKSLSEARARCRRSRRRARRLFQLAALSAIILLALPASVSADHLRLVDGTTIEVDEAWEDSQGIWYRQGGVTHLIERFRVRAIERRQRAEAAKATADAAAVKVVEGTTAAAPKIEQSILIYLVGGAKMEVDEVTENADGLWYKRGNISIFIERARVDHVEREQIAAAESDPAVGAKRRERAWSTGNARIDALIRQNGARHGVDPYLIFCVMEQESHFNPRVVSSAGARGLMQLMPGTAARFGVRNVHDPAQNISGGTRYLKQLLRMFRGRVDLTLASYNAGEGAVMKYGHRVPPYRETRNYVRRISARYQRGS